MQRSPSGRLVASGVVSAALAASAVVIRNRVREVEAAYPPEGQFLEVEGVRLHYVVRGAGQPLVLLHGNLTSLLELELAGLIDRAAERYQVIAFDRPGFGYSSRPRTTAWTPQAQATLLLKALARMGVQQPIAVGHSWGALVALGMGLADPNAVRSLVLLSGYYFPTARLDALLMGPPGIPGVGDALRFTVSPWLLRLVWPSLSARLFSPSPVTASFRAYPAWMAARPSQLRAAAADALLMIPSVTAMRHRYAELTMPVMIMAGTDDRYVDTGWHSVRLHREIPGSELTLAPGVGHMVQHVVADEVMAAIDAAASAPQRAPLVSTSPRMRDALPA